MKTFFGEHIIARILLVLLTVVVLICIFWTPFDRLKLLRPIPANAVLVSSRHQLFSGSGSMATNVFLKTLYAHDAAAGKFFRGNCYAARIAAAQSVIAYVPDLSRSSYPALVITSWIGGWAPVFRWALWLLPQKDIMPLGEYNSRRLWMFKNPVSFLGAASFLSFAFDEGVFIGCLSPDRNGIIQLLRIYDERADSILSVPQYRFAERSLSSNQLWLRFDPPYSGQTQSVVAVGTLAAFENDYLAASIRFEPGLRRKENPVRHQNLPEFRKISACSPSIVALLPSDLAANALAAFVAPLWAGKIKPLLVPAAGESNVCLLAVLSDPYGGKMGNDPFRINVPTILIAVAGCQAPPTKAAIGKMLDLLNAKHHLGLALNSTAAPAGKYPVTIIEATSSALLNSLPLEDLPAFAFYNDWLLLASNGAGLKKMLLHFQAEAGLSAGGTGNRPGQDELDRAPAFIRIDPDKGGKALRLGIMAAIIMLDRDSTRPANKGAVEVLKVARSWLEGLSGLEDCRIWLEPEGEGTMARIEVGRKGK